MASRQETFESIIYVNNEQAQDAIAKMQKNLDKLNAEYEKVVESNGEFSKEALKLRKEIDKQTTTIENAQKGIENYEKAMKNLDGSSLNELTKLQKALRKEIENTKPNSPEWKELTKNYQKVTDQANKVRNSMKGLNTESTGLGRAFQGVSKFGNKFGLAIMAIPNMITGAIAAMKGIINVTKQVINGSQSMADKWNNGIAAMKTTTQAFFAALSSGDWTAFNNGIAAALKKARELAEVMDQLGSFKIAKGYMESNYLVDYNKQVATATDTEQDNETRRAAIEAAQADLEAYNEFIRRESESTFDALMLMFETSKGITFSSREEFDKFFDELFRNVTTGGNQSVIEVQKYIDSVVAELTKLHVEEDLIYADYTRSEAMSIALAQATEKYGEELVTLYRASELNDEKLQQLVQTYQQYRSSVDKAAQMERSFNRTRDRVMKQTSEYGNALKVAEKAKNDEIAIYKQKYAEGEISREEYEKEIARIEEQWKQTQLNIAKKYGEDTSKLDAQILDERVKERDAAYGNAIKDVDAQEKAQLLVLKRNYAAGIINQEDYEMQKSDIELDYMKRRINLAEQYGQDTTTLENQILDRRLSEESKRKQEAYNNDLRSLEKAQQDEENAMNQAHANRQISDRDYESNMTQIKMQFLQKRLELVRKYGMDDTAAQQAIIDAQIEAQEAAVSKLEKMKQDAQAVLDKLNPGSADARELESQLAALDELHEAKLLSEQEYEEAVSQLEREYAEKNLKMKLEKAQDYIQKSQSYLNAAASFTGALQSAETAQLEAEYNQRLAAAGNNAEERERIEQEYEQKKLDMKKKYADVDMVVNIAKAIAAGALAAVEAFAAAGGNPVLGGIFAAIIAATTAAEVATIIAQRNAIKNATVASSGGNGAGAAAGQRTVTGYSGGGYTDNAANDNKPVGIVHANEWVAPAWMVRRNPGQFADLERYRRTGQHAHVRAAGFAEGGYTGNGKNTTLKLDTTGLSAAVGAAVGQAMRENPVRSYVVRNDITELDNQDQRFNKQTSR